MPAIIEALKRVFKDTRTFGDTYLFLGEIYLYVYYLLASYFVWNTTKLIAGKICRM